METTGPEGALFLRATLAERVLEGLNSIQVQPWWMEREVEPTHGQPQQMEKGLASKPGRGHSEPPAEAFLRNPR